MKLIRKFAPSLTAAVMLIAVTVSPSHSVVGPQQSDALDKTQEVVQSQSLDRNEEQAMALLVSETTDAHHNSSNPRDLAYTASGSNQFRTLDIFAPDWRGDFSQNGLRRAHDAGYQTVSADH